MLPIKVLPAAQQDFDESFDWYRAKSRIAANGFAEAIEASFVRISRDFESLARLDGLNQECRVKRFPFRVVFQKLEDCILIIAIAHAKRRPDYWKNRG